MTKNIATIAELEACVGAAGAPVKMKIIDHLDAAAARWTAAAPIAFLGAASNGQPRPTLAGGPAGFARAVSDKILRIPVNCCDDPSIFTAGAGAGALFLIPGIGETLRANGAVEAISEAGIDLRIEECFIHCAKALIRSDFWTPAAEPPANEPAAFINAARFLALVTMDAAGRIDVSPKGDPAGLLIRIKDGAATLAERPGNRLAFGYRNIVEQQRVAALAIVPGAHQAGVLTGAASLTTDEDIRGPFTVDGKSPILATIISGAETALHASGALERAALWSGAHAKSDIDPADALVAHIKLNKARGVGATMLRLAANRGLIARGLESNYKTDLY